MSAPQPFQLTYDASVVSKDIPRLSPDIKDKIQRTIEYKLTQFPQKFGEPLRYSMKGAWKLRIGDYRVLYRISGQVVQILRIGHRREIYKKLL